MEIKKMEKKINWIILSTIIIVAVLSGLYSNIVFFGDPRLVIQSIFSSVSLAGTIILVLIFYNIYRVRKAKFTLGLLAAMGALAVSAFLRNPLRRFIIELGRTTGFWAFALETMFWCIAILILLYLAKD